LKSKRVIRGVIVGTFAAILLSGCATPNQAKRSRFSGLTVEDSAVHEAEAFRIEAVRVSAACLREMFRTGKVNKESRQNNLTIFWDCCIVGYARCNYHRED
jgi:hypothetical protein